MYRYFTYYILLNILKYAIHLVNEFPHLPGWDIQIRMYHQPNLSDGFLDFFHIHACYLCQGSAIGISLVHIADINARTPSYLFGKEPEFLPHQIGMVVTLIIERTDELDKLQRPVLRLFHYRDNLSFYKYG